eukprot:8446409-Pyramimonas_sp.AAC.1
MLVYLARAILKRTLAGLPGAQEQRAEEEDASPFVRSLSRPLSRSLSNTSWDSDAKETSEPRRPVGQGQFIRRVMTSVTQTPVVTSRESVVTETPVVTSGESVVMETPVVTSGESV